MKTGVTILNTEQVSYDELRTVRKTKVFDDNATISEIKDWIMMAGKYKIPKEKVGLSGIDISDIEEKEDTP